MTADPVVSTEADLLDGFRDELHDRPAPAEPGSRPVPAPPAPPGAGAAAAAVASAVAGVAAAGTGWAALSLLVLTGTGLHRLGDGAWSAAGPVAAGRELPAPDGDGLTGVLLGDVEAAVRAAGAHGYRVLLQRAGAAVAAGQEVAAGGPVGAIAAVPVAALLRAGVLADGEVPVAAFTVTAAPVPVTAPPD